MRRLLWLLLAGSLGLMVGQLLDLSLTLSVLLGVLVLLLTAAGFAYNSWSRHLEDFEARNLRR